MNKTIILAAATAFVSAQAGFAQEAGFTWEGEVEVGVDSTVSASDSSAEITDTYLSGALAFEAAVTDRLSVFGGLTLESVLDPEASRSFDDLGIYVSELGLRYSVGNAQSRSGKLARRLPWHGTQRPVSTAQHLPRITNLAR